MSKPVYCLNTGEITAGANKVFVDLFNAVGSGYNIELIGFYVKPKSDVAVTGAVNPKFNLHLTSTIGSSGQNVAYASTSATAASIIPFDSLQSPLPTQITARTSPGAGATISARLASIFAISEETNAGVTNQQNLNALKHGVTVIVHEGQGIAVKQGSVASLNDYEIELWFTLGDNV